MKVDDRKFWKIFSSTLSPDLAYPKILKKKNSMWLNQILTRLYKINNFLVFLYYFNALISKIIILKKIIILIYLWVKKYFIK
jgi:hypothetical protein